MKEVRVSIAGGRVITDWAGFAGPRCFEAAEALAAQLAALGVHVDPKEIVPKPEAGGVRLDSREREG